MTIEEFAEALAEELEAQGRRQFSHPVMVADLIRRALQTTKKASKEAKR